MKSQQEKLQKEAMKIEEAQRKKLEKEKKKWEKGKFALKSTVAEIDRKVVEQGSIGGMILLRSIFFKVHSLTVTKFHCLRNY